MGVLQGQVHKTYLHEMYKNIMYNHNVQITLKCGNENVAVKGGGF